MRRGPDMTLIVKYWSSFVIIFNLSSQKANLHQYFSRFSLLVLTGSLDWGCCRCSGRSATSVSACLLSIKAPTSPDGPARRHLLCSLVWSWLSTSSILPCTCLYWSEGSCWTHWLSTHWATRYFSSVRNSTSTLAFYQMIWYDMIYQ